MQDCIHDKLWKSLLDNVDPSGSNHGFERARLDKFKAELFASIEQLKTAYFDNNYIQEQGESIRMLLVTIFNDLSERTELKDE